MNKDDVAKKKHDTSDRKSLDLLLQQSMFHSTRNYKQSTISSFFSPGDSESRRAEKSKPQTSLRRSKRTTKSPNRSRTLKGDKRNKPRTTKDKGRTYPKLSKESSSKNELKPATGDRSQKKTKSDSSYVKYGIHVPTFDDIIKDKKDLESYKACLDSIEMADTSFELPKVRESLSADESNKLDCKYLTSKEIKLHFKLHYEYLREISKEQRYSERHERFKNHSGCINKLNLCYNTSMIVFSDEQKQILARLLYKKFGKSSHGDNYYFNVLLPELCLKIFMEEHKMSYREASQYLD